MDSRLKEIYSSYYTQKEKDFIELLKFIGENGLEKIEKAIQVILSTNSIDINTEKIKFICNRDISLDVCNNYFENKSSETIDKSREMLGVYTKMLSAVSKEDSCREVIKIKKQLLNV